MTKNTNPKWLLSLFVHRQLLRVVIFDFCQATVSVSGGAFVKSKLFVLVLGYEMYCKTDDNLKMFALSINFMTRPRLLRITTPFNNSMTTINVYFYESMFSNLRM